MSKLGAFFNSGEELDLGKGVKVEVFSIPVRKMQSFQNKKVDTIEEQQKTAYELIKLSLKNEEVTEEEIDNMPTQAFVKLMEKIYEVNGVEKNDADKIQNRIKEMKK